MVHRVDLAGQDLAAQKKLVEPVPLPAPHRARVARLTDVRLGDRTSGFEEPLRRWAEAKVVFRLVVSETVLRAWRAAA